MSKRIIVVGESKTLFEKENGHKIDNFDYVVRVAPRKIRGNEKCTGIKANMLRVAWKQHFALKDIEHDVEYKDTELQNFEDILFTNLDDYDNYTEAWSYIANKKQKPRFVEYYYVKKHKNTRYLHDRCMQAFLSYHPHIKNVYYCDNNVLINSTKIACKDGSKIIPTTNLLVINYIINMFPNEQITITGYDHATQLYYKNNDTCSTAHNNINEYIYLKQLAKIGKIKFLE